MELTDVMTAVLNTARPCRAKGTTVSPFRTIPDHPGHLRTPQWETPQNTTVGNTTVGNTNGDTPMRTHQWSHPQWSHPQWSHPTVESPTERIPTERYTTTAPGPVPRDTTQDRHVPGTPLPRLPHHPYHHHWHHPYHGDWQFYQKGWQTGPAE